jgi:2-oxoglutarate ferredoxin oxidoreductase subunit alpha|tara:strand:- start:18 stop:1493 length:1476 start_codon:yes stop_codon:yes gene_type:complete
MRINIVFGGEAGQGSNILSHILGKTLIEKGYFVFYSRDYQSIIRGGHNFNILTFSNESVTSNDSKIDILVCLDKKTEEIHKRDLNENGIVLNGKKSNMYFSGAISKILNLDFQILEKQLKKLNKFKENLEEAKKGYEQEKRKLDILNVDKNNFYFMSGNQGISQGAIKSGLDIYYSYPITPATFISNELVKDENVLVLELESELAVINAVVGSSITGAKAMTGTSAGGFDLMTETLSLTGIAEIPLVVYFGQRPGPGTGIPTYTAQGDLNCAIYSGHGEFPKLVIAPGDVIEAQELTSHAFYFSQKYKIPSIILGDKHLGESFYTLSSEPKITPSEKTTSLKKYSGNEITEKGETTSNAEIVKSNFERRLKTIDVIKKDAENFEMFKVYGNKNSKNIIIGWGSTKGAILDCIKNLDVKFIQVLYLEPFPEKIKQELEKAEKIILIENNSTGQLGELIAKKTGIFIEDKILKYDGRSFFADELEIEIRGKLE